MRVDDVTSNVEADFQSRVPDVHIEISSLITIFVVIFHHFQRVQVQNQSIHRDLTLFVRKFCCTFGGKLTFAYVFEMNLCFVIWKQS